MSIASTISEPDKMTDGHIRNSEATVPSFVEPNTQTTILDYVLIARPDHWFKNVFLLAGTLLAFFYHPQLFHLDSLWRVVWALATTCIAASSNYVVNEILDAPTDLNHPVKRFRPIPSGRIFIPFAYIEWIVLAMISIAMARVLNSFFLYSTLAFLSMGIIYNVRPFRSKEYPYLDVLSESLNNPLRLLLGWSAVTSIDFPPVSLLISYWMIGAFFMAAKRFAEYRSLANHSVASAYRSSFRHYDEQKLLISMVFYVTTFALFLGVFIVRYRPELILLFPLIAGFICYYLYVTYQPDSPAQRPEHLYRERNFMFYLVFCVVMFFALMFIKVPQLYDLFNISPAPAPALWEVGQ
jgi:decaprenyl-phosphate phosphoribosyltransferase